MQFLSNVYYALLKDMIQSEVGKRKAFEWHFFVNSYSSLLNDRLSSPAARTKGINAGSKETTKMGGKEQRKRSEERNENRRGHCKDIIYSWVGPSWNQLGYQKPRTPLPFSNNPQWAGGLFPTEWGSLLHELPKVLLKSISWRILEHISIWRVS